MYHALLLSPDDQAVSAITSVLEEMSVTCERPLDGGSAAQKLNSQSFDLVLVDCENLPAAKLIFDVCRRGKNGHNPVPIAIVDGRAGLPTAFRLGAELILTKPVAKDQARTTIRTAVGRVRKDDPANEDAPVQAAAASVSPQLTSYADQVPGFVPATTPSGAPNAVSTAARFATVLKTKMHSAADEADAAPVAAKSSAPSASAIQKPVRPLHPSDDPVLAELERTELEESDATEAQTAKSSGTKAAPEKAVAKSDAPVFSSYQHGQSQRRGPLVAFVVLVLAGAGFYAAWTLQPGFRETAQSQIDRVLALAGMAQPSRSMSPAPNPAKPAAQPVVAKAPAPAPPTTTDPNQTPSPTADSAATSPTGSPAAAAVAVQPATPGAIAPSTSAAADPAASVPSHTEAAKPGNAKAIGARKDDGTAASPESQLPGENSAIILSSKGAEKRLAHSVPAKYPAEARSGGAQGTIVLKEVVDETGKVKGVRLVEGDATLATAAIKAVKQWRYRPYVRDGKAQPFQTVVIIDFSR